MNQYKPFPAKTIPELRHTLVSYHRRVTPTLWTQMLTLGKGGLFWIPTRWAHLPHHQIAAHLANAEAERVQNAQLFSITRSATVEAITAGKVLPRFVLHPAHLPAEHGLLVWDEPIDVAYGGNDPIVACSWGPYENEQVWVSFYVDGRQATATLKGTARVEAEQILHPLGFEREIVLPFGQRKWYSQQPGFERLANDYEKALRTLLATWLHMGQERLTHTSSEPADAKSRVARTLAKRGRPLPPVKVVTLRPTEPASEQGRGQGRKLTKRVEVGAYWRRRPHATGDGPEDMVWVCGHERGPEDAPASGGVVVKR